MFYSGQRDRWVTWFPWRKKRHVNEKQDQQPKATLNASCKLFHCSHTALLHVGLPSSSQQWLRVKTAASPDVARSTGISDTDKSWRWREEESAALSTLLLRRLLQSALWSSRALKPLWGDDGLMGHTLSHHVPFPPQCDFLHGLERLVICTFQNCKKLIQASIRSP